MSQEKLGSALGLTFQQVQKYERGANKVGASRLYEMSRVLNVPIGFFFDDLISGTHERSIAALGGGFAEPPPNFLKGDDADEAAPETGAPMLDDMSLELLRAFQHVSDARVRQHLVNLVKSMAAPA